MTPAPDAGRSRGLRDVSRSLDNIEATALDAHKQLDGLREWSLSTLDVLEHEYEYVALELENDELANDVAALMALVHTLYRRVTEHELLAQTPPWLLDALADDHETDSL